MKRGIVVLVAVLLLTSTAFAQDITEKQIQERIAKLEQMKTQLEQAYNEVVIRLNELNTVIAPEKAEDKKADSEVKSGK